MKQNTNNLKNLGRHCKQLFVALTFLLSMTGYNSFAGSNDWTSWSIWHVTDCYSGISFRYRERHATNDKNQVQMEIRNNYSKGISVSHFITTDRSKSAIYRIDIEPGEVYTSEQYVDRSRKFYLLLDKMRFDGDQYGDPYRGCDR